MRVGGQRESFIGRPTAPLAAERPWWRRPGEASEFLRRHLLGVSPSAVKTKDPQVPSFKEMRFEDIQIDEAARIPTLQVDFEKSCHFTQADLRIMESPESHKVAGGGKILLKSGRHRQLESDPD